MDKKKSTWPFGPDRLRYYSRDGINYPVYMGIDSAAPHVSDEYVDKKPTLEVDGKVEAFFENPEIYEAYVAGEYDMLDRLKKEITSAIANNEGFEKVNTKTDSRWAAGEPVVVTGPAEETWPFTPTGRRKATPAFVPKTKPKSGPFDSPYPWQKEALKKVRDVDYKPIEERILSHYAFKDWSNTPPSEDAMFPERFSKEELDVLKSFKDSPGAWWRKYLQQKTVINSDALDALARYGKEDNRLYNTLTNKLIDVQSGSVVNYSFDENRKSVVFVDNNFWPKEINRGTDVIARIFEKRKQKPTMETILVSLEALHKQAVKLEDVLKEGQDIEAAAMGFLAGGMMACFGPVEFDGKRYDDFDLQHFVSGKARLYGVLEKHPNIYEDVRILDKEAIEIYRNFADFLEVALPSLSILESKTEDGKFVSVMRYRPFDKDGGLLPTGNGTSRYRYVSILLAALRILIWAFRDAQISTKRLIKLGVNVQP